MFLISLDEQLAFQGEQLTGDGLPCHEEFNEIDVENVVFTVSQADATTEPTSQPSTPPSLATRTLLKPHSEDSAVKLSITATAESTYMTLL
jgi:hypothetical protein